MPRAKTQRKCLLGSASQLWGELWEAMKQRSAQGRRNFAVLLPRLPNYVGTSEVGLGCKSLVRFATK